MVNDTYNNHSTSLVRTPVQGKFKIPIGVIGLLAHQPLIFCLLQLSGKLPQQSYKGRRSH